MKKKRIVIALGGNALGNTPQEQIAAVRMAAEAIADLAYQGHEIIVGHGNGPQVGMINKAMSTASSAAVCPEIPFAECGAMSQGYIGYHLQQALQQALIKRRMNKTVVSVVTQVLVDKDDPAFQNPTKPIGSFYTKAEADKIAKETGYQFMEDAGRGYRRVVASPEPKKIIELSAIRKIVQSGLLVIAAGGGGIPVVEVEQGLAGIDAVIDKDKSCAKLAQEIKADILMILTAVDNICIHFNQPNQEKLYDLTVVDAERYIEEGMFAKGSMLPKVQASLGFVKALPGRMAIITSLNQAKDALKECVGTKIFSPKTMEVEIGEPEDISPARKWRLFDEDEESAG